MFELRIDKPIVSEKGKDWGGLTLFWEMPNTEDRMWQCMKNYSGKPLGEQGVYHCQIYRIPAKKYNDETIEWHLDTYDWINDEWSYDV